MSFIRDSDGSLWNINDIYLISIEWQSEENYSIIAHSKTFHGKIAIFTNSLEGCEIYLKMLESEFKNV